MILAIYIRTKYCNKTIYWNNKEINRIAGMIWTCVYGHHVNNYSRKFFKPLQARLYVWSYNPATDAQSVVFFSIYLGNDRAWLVLRCFDDTFKERNEEWGCWLAFSCCCYSAPAVCLVYIPQLRVSPGGFIR